MKNLIVKIALLPILLALVLAGCSLEAPSDPTDEVNPLALDEVPAAFSAIGNSLTAGYMDTGLRMEGQMTSVPRLIANQMGLGAEEFTQPYIAPPGIGTTNVGEGNVASSMYFNGSTIDLIEVMTLADVPAMLLAAAQPLHYHNLGVPGAWATDVLNAYDKGSSFGETYDRGNSYFDFINRASLFGNEMESASYPDPQNPGTMIDVEYQTASQFRQAVAKGSRITTLWIGGNDIYLGATSGNPNGVGGVPVTPVMDFAASLQNMVALLAGGQAARLGWDPATQTGVQPIIVLANLPDLDDVPHFIPTAVFESVIAGMGAPVPGYDESDVSYVLLNALAWVPQNLGQDLPSVLTLTAGEVALVQGHVDGYNQTIAAVAAGINTTGLAKVDYVDARAFLDGLPTPAKTLFLFLLPQHAAPWSPAEIEAAAATTYFSLDGFHPNNKGYAAIANLFIQKINELDGSSIPAVDVGSVVWDPTYGIAAGKSAATPGVFMTPRAGQALSGMFK